MTESNLHLEQKENNRAVDSSRRGVKHSRLRIVPSTLYAMEPTVWQGLIDD